MEIVSAIRLIQKNERGRQYRNRLNLILNTTLENIKKEERKKKLREGHQTEPTNEQKDAAAAVSLQKRLRGILARKRVEEMRMEELIFLGMAPKPKTKE